MDTAPPFRLRFVGPRWWPTWLGIGLLRALCCLPVPAVLKLGEAIGGVLGARLKSRRHVVRVNLAICFPELDPAQRENLVDAHFAALGRGLFEAGLAWFASDARLRPHGEVRGLEHLRAATREGRGALLLTGHFTSLELAGRFLAIEGVRFHAMYRRINNELIDYFMHRWRERRSHMAALPKDDLKKLLRALRDGKLIWYAPDQALELRNAVSVPFFSRPVLTITATSRLAQLGRAAVVPYFPRIERGRYVVEILPALAAFPSGDDTADARAVNAAIEGGVRAAPADYFWVHRRFKRWDPAQEDVYAGR
ncbi:MAG TPA: hypothetical protein VM074_04720 [Solimonas sp.]|nr:hypothetical protein [Solimonas sp.]